MTIANHLSRIDVEGIYSSANSALWHSHTYAARNTLRKAREEDYVAAFIEEGIPILAERWQKILEANGLAVRIAGLFCHGHPQVRFGLPQQQVELADVLVVHQYLGRKRSACRAVLIQAKMSLHPELVLSASDPQLELFSNWPTFEFVTGGLLPGKRKFGSNAKGSRYALVLSHHAYPEDISWADQCPWAACLPRQHLSGEQSIAKVLGDLLLFRDGRPTALSRPRNDWSKTIKELLEITGKRTYRRTNLGIGPTPRLSRPSQSSPSVLYLAGGEKHTFHANPRTKRASIVNRMFGNVVTDDFEIGDGSPPESQLEDGGRGISVVIIETIEVEG